MADTIRLRGEGGAEWEFTLPLDANLAKQLEARRLTPADADAEAYVAALEADTEAAALAAAQADADAKDPAPVDEDQAEDQADDGDEDGAPPRGGPGSGRDEWAAHAAELGLEVSDDMTRDDIIAAVEAAGA